MSTKFIIPYESKYMRMEKMFLWEDLDVEGGGRPFQSSVLLMMCDMVKLLIQIIRESPEVSKTLRDHCSCQ